MMLGFRGIWINKQPKAIFFGKWKPRFWILKRDKLKYYENEESINHLGVIDFNKVEASVYILTDDHCTFKIALKGSYKVFLFRASSSEDAALWVEKLDDCIHNSRGKHLSLTITDPKFWKDIYIDVNEFKSVVDNWDLLLFKSKQLATKLQRTLTNSNYDHVGMIVLWETDDDMNTIFLLEAVSSEGVRLVEFLPNLEAYFEVYEKIVYRPLQNFERSEDWLNSLDTFLDEVLGK